MNNKSKRYFSIFMALLLLVALVQLPQTNVFAASKLSSFANQQVSKAIVLRLGSPNTLVNSAHKQLDHSSKQIKPILKKGTTYVPLRFMSENLGAKVAWDQKSRTATVTYGTKVIKATVGQSKVKINSTYKAINSPIFQSGDRVYLPLRIISESFGKNVFYNNGIIIISSTKPALTQPKEQQLVGELLTWFNSVDYVELTVRQIVERYDDSVVTVLVNDYYRQPVAQGSGFYIGNGLFVTNNHVLATGYSYKLVLNNGQVLDVAGIVKYDEAKDLAIIKTKQLPNLKPVLIGTKQMVQKGDRIVTIGSPLGLTNTVSDGLVSAFRNVDAGIDLIQITAPITHGSSGSPLFSIHGYVVGINTLGYEGSGNLNFAVSIDMASAWIKELLAKDFRSISVMSQAAYMAQGEAAPSWSETPQLPIGFDVELDFQIDDALKHPTKPIVYFADRLNNKVYSVNYQTKEQKSIAFDYAPESMDFYNGELFVAMPLQAHDYYTDKPLKGIIATIETEGFTLKDQFEIDMDPFDIAAGRDGHIYVTSGSNQWSDIASYSLTTKQRVSKAMIYAGAFVALSPTYNKLYTISTGLSPRDITVYNISDGIFTGGYDSPYHGDYDMGMKIKFSPDGRYVFNNAGTIFAAGQGKDLTYAGKLGGGYNDVSFHLASNSVYAGKAAGIIDVYDYKTFSKKGTIQTMGSVLYLFQDGDKIIAVTKDDNKTLSKVRSGLMIVNTQ